MAFSSIRVYLVLNNFLKGSQSKGWLGMPSAVLFMGFLKEDDKTKVAWERVCGGEVLCSCILNSTLKTKEKE